MRLRSEKIDAAKPRFLRSKLAGWKQICNALLTCPVLSCQRTAIAGRQAGEGRGGGAAEERATAAHCTLVRHLKMPTSACVSRSAIGGRGLDAGCCAFAYTGAFSGTAVLHTGIIVTRAGRDRTVSPNCGVAARRAAKGCHDRTDGGCKWKGKQVEDREMKRLGRASAD